MKMIEHNHFICHLILGIFTEYPFLYSPSLHPADVKGVNCLLEVLSFNG